MLTKSKKFRLSYYSKNGKSGRRICYANFGAGFTLIEIIVALGVFTVAVLISLGSFLAVLGAQRKAVAVGTIQENLNIALEIMLKDIRVGRSYFCSNDINNFEGNGSNTNNCPNGGKIITILSRDKIDNKIVSYRVKNMKLEKAIKDVGSGNFTDSDFVPITFDDLKITNLTFYVTGSTVINDAFQPKVTITIKGEMGTGKALSNFNIQTTVSQRMLDK